MPKKVRFNRLRLVIQSADRHEPHKPDQPTASGPEKESNFRVLGAELRKALGLGRCVAPFGSPGQEEVPTGRPAYAIQNAAV